jgi:NAD(P)H dehydrogenase (quinone)
MDRGPIGVTGATGGLGGRVARRLADHGVPQRLLVRDPARAPELDRAEVATFGGYDDAEGVRRALDGVDTLFLVSAAEDRDRVGLHKRMVDAVVAAGVGRIVYTSFVGAAPDCTFTFGRDHFHTEEHIKATGAGYTFLRDNLYLDFIPGLSSPDGVIRGPAGEGRVAAVARDDIADVAVEVLVGDGHEGQTYDLTGAEAFTMAEAAEELSRASGRLITFEDETLEEARESRRPSGAADYEIEGWVTSYAAIAAGEVEAVSDCVQRFLDRPPWRLGDWLRENPESYRHLLHPAA